MDIPAGKQSGRSRTERAPFYVFLPGGTFFLCSVWVSFLSFRPRCEGRPAREASSTPPSPRYSFCQHPFSGDRISGMSAPPRRPSEGHAWQGQVPRSRPEDRPAGGRAEAGPRLQLSLGWFVNTRAVISRCEPAFGAPAWQNCLLLNQFSRVSAIAACINSELLIGNIRCHPMGEPSFAVKDTWSHRVALSSGWGGPRKAQASRASSPDRPASSCRSLRLVRRPSPLPTSSLSFKRRGGGGETEPGGQRPGSACSK